MEILGMENNRTNGIRVLEIGSKEWEFAHFVDFLMNPKTN